METGFTATYPCERCGSIRHSTQGHEKLEIACRRWGIGLISLGPQGDLASEVPGETGPPSPLTSGGVRPDLLRILPYELSVAGMRPIIGVATSRWWKQAPGEGGSIFTLSLPPGDPDGVAPLLGAICGGHGSVVTVALGSNLSSLEGARRGT